MMMRPRQFCELLRRKDKKNAASLNFLNRLGFGRHAYASLGGLRIAHNFRGEIFAQGQYYKISLKRLLATEAEG